MIVYAVPSKDDGLLFLSQDMYNEWLERGGVPYSDYGFLWMPNSEFDWDWLNVGDDDD